MKLGCLPHGHKAIGVQSRVRLREKETFFDLTFFFLKVQAEEGQREKIQSRLLAKSSEPSLGLELTKREIMT